MENRNMQKVKLYEMIITCESCGNVKRFPVQSQEDCERLFNGFRCENNCGKNLLSFISVGLLEREQYQVPKINLQYAIAK